MISIASLVEIIKCAATEAGDAADPCGILFGTVAGVGPLRIQVDQKLVLTEDFLILTSAVKDYDAEMEVSHVTGPGGEGSHTHPYTGRKVFSIKNGLKTGEHVLLLRVQGGQKYIVLDRG